MKHLLMTLLLSLSATTALAERWVDISNSNSGNDVELLDIDYTANPVNSQLRVFRYVLGTRGENTYSQMTVQIDCASKLMRRIYVEQRLRSTHQVINTDKTGLWIPIHPVLIGNYPPHDLICR